MKGCTSMATVRVVAGCVHDLSEFVWRKSSWSGADNCVEVAFRDAVFVRDSKNPDDGVLTFPPTGWVQFLNAAASEQFLCGK